MKNFWQHPGAWLRLRLHIIEFCLVSHLFSTKQIIALTFFPQQISIKMSHFTHLFWILRQSDWVLSENRDWNWFSNCLHFWNLMYIPFKHLDYKMGKYLSQYIISDEKLFMYIFEVFESFCIKLNESHVKILLFIKIQLNNRLIFRDILIAKSNKIIICMQSVHCGLWSG